MIDWIRLSKNAYKSSDERFYITNVRDKISGRPWQLQDFDEQEFFTKGIYPELTLEKCKQKAEKLLEI